MRYLLCYALLLVLPPVSYSQTTVPAGNVSGTWTKAGSPYKIQGEITVPKGSTLTLQPGTTLEFGGMYGLTVNGILKAQGAKGDSITFTAASNKTWAGIYYNKNTQADTIRFNYCRWINVGFGERVVNELLNYGILARASSPVIVKNTLFNFTLNNDTTQGGLIYCIQSPCFLDSIKVISSGRNITPGRGLFFIDSVSRFDIRNISYSNLNGACYCMFIHDSYGNINNPNVIRNIKIENCPLTYIIAFVSASYCQVENITVNKAFQVSMFDCQGVYIRNSIFSNCTSAFFTAGKNFGSTVENCVFQNCGKYRTPYPLFTLNLQGNGPLFYKCRFLDNEAGISVSQDYGVGKPIFLNCLLKGTWKVPSFIEGYPVFINSNIQNNTSMLGVLNTYVPYYGGIVVGHEDYQSKPYFYDCVLWGNKDTVDHHNSIVLTSPTDQAFVDHCLVQGDSSSGIIGYDADNTQLRFYPGSKLTYTNSSGQAPGFTDSASGNYTLLNTCNQTAYAINKGIRGNLLTTYPYDMLYNTYGLNIYEATDLNGNPRVMDDTIDIGCYESAGNKKILKLHTNPNDTTLCFGAKGMYTASHFGAVQQYHWQQKVNSTISDFGTSRSISVPPGAPISGARQYRLLAVNNECLPLKDSSRWFTVTVNPPQKKGITRLPNVDTIQLKDTLKLFTSISGYKTIAWSNGAAGGNTYVAGKKLGEGSHIITIEATTTAGCTERDTLHLFVKPNSGIHNILAGRVRIYPQPAGNTLAIATEMPLTGAIALSGMDGRVLLRQALSEALTTIDLSALQSGIYILSIRTSDGLSWAGTVIKE